MHRRLVRQHKTNYRGYKIWKIFRGISPSTLYISVLLDLKRKTSKKPFLTFVTRKKNNFLQKTCIGET